MKRLRLFVGVMTFLLIMAGCQSFNEQKNELPDHADKGTINVSADESFQPIIDEMVKVYESNHPGTKINVHYKTEADCIQDLATDSVRMIIVTRGFSQDEKEFLLDSMKVSPERMIVARDAIAVIVNPTSPDSLFTMPELRQVLKGSFSRTLIPVFDGVKATSTVRFIIDSVLKGDSLTPKAVAARTSVGVIDYVAKTPNAIGFIGVSWIGNREDTAQLSFLKKVRIASIESTDKPGAYVKPYQANIYTRRYPVVRDLVYILKENYKGLGHGFAGFMSGEIGQLIFRRAYLVPAKKSFGVRPIRLNENNTE
jgi:phosphate transport system substrate-binding protein